MSVCCNATEFGLLSHWWLFRTVTGLSWRFQLWTNYRILTRPSFILTEPIRVRQSVASRPRPFLTKFIRFCTAVVKLLSEPTMQFPCKFSLWADESSRNTRFQTRFVQFLLTNLSSWMMLRRSLPLLKQAMKRRSYCTSNDKEKILKESSEHRWPWLWPWLNNLFIHISFMIYNLFILLNNW